MKMTEVTLEMLIKTYAEATGKDGIFINIFEANENLRELLGFTEQEMIDQVHNYLYLTDFKNVKEIKNLFNKIEKKSHPDAQYMALVVNSEIAKEYPLYE